MKMRGKEDEEDEERADCVRRKGKKQEEGQIVWVWRLCGCGVWGVWRSCGTDCGGHVGETKWT